MSSIDLSLPLTLTWSTEDTVDVKKIRKQKDKRTKKTIKTIGLWGGVLLWRILCLLHQEEALPSLASLEKSTFCVKMPSNTVLFSLIIFRVAVTLKWFSRQITCLSTMSKELVFLWQKNWSESFLSSGRDTKMPPSEVEITFSPAFVHRFMACMLLNLRSHWFSLVVCRERMHLGRGWGESHTYCWLEIQVSETSSGREKIL